MKALGSRQSFSSGLIATGDVRRSWRLPLVHRAGREITRVVAPMVPRSPALRRLALSRLVADPLALDEQTIRELARGSRAGRSTGAAGTAIVHAGLRDRIDRVRVPVLVVFGEEDRVIDPAGRSPARGGASLGAAPDAAPDGPHGDDRAPGRGRSRDPRVDARGHAGSVSAPYHAPMHRVTTLPGGLRVASEHMDGLRSVSVGFWIDAGSRDERPDQRGLAHFIEHLLFKGGARHDATAIAELFDELGAELNAATAKDSTLLYARVLDDHLPLALDVMTDMLRSPSWSEIEQEREVVLEEIAMVEDAPQDGCTTSRRSRCSARTTRSAIRSSASRR